MKNRAPAAGTKSSVAPPVPTRNVRITCASAGFTSRTIVVPVSAEYPCDLKSVMISSRSPGCTAAAPEVRKWVCVPSNDCPL